MVHSCGDITETAAASTTTVTAACRQATGWANVVDGDDFPIYQTLGQASPGSIRASGPASATNRSLAPSRLGTSSTVLQGSAVASSARLVPVPSSMHQGPGNGSSVPRGASLGTRASHSGPLITGPSSENPLRTPLTVSVSATTPSCMADGAPWFSPSSWCYCGPSSTYPTLLATSNATTANCAYTSLPASTIQPVTISAPPMNIPGKYGVPGCAAVASSDGKSAYCNCGGTPAPTLSPTADGLLNCAYTVQPTSSYNPQQSTATPPPPPSLPYTPGQCNVHIWEALGQEISDPQVIINVIITDADGNSIGNNSGSLDWGQTLETNSELPWTLQVTPQKKYSSRRRLFGTFLRKRVGGPIPMRPIYKHGPVDFAYASQKWDTSSSQCSVGDWDDGNANDIFGTLIFGDKFLPNRQMDCKFECSALAASSGKRDMHGDDDKIGREDVKSNPSPTTANYNPTPIDEHLFKMQGALSRRINHGAAWVKYAPSGARYYKAWQDKAGEDTVYQCNFDNDFELHSPVKRVQPVRGIRPVLEGAGYSIGREYYAVSAYGPKDNPISDFTNTISASQGVFLANANNRGALPSDPADPRYISTFPNGRDPIPWQFSSVAWEMWKRTVLAENPNWVADPSQADYSGIKSFWRREIDNSDTVSILTEAFAGKDITSIQTWYPTDSNQDSNPFWALLGSPNGNGIQHFLTDNKVALKGKGIISISATTIGDDFGRSFTMWATFG
ncbi:hypothetical protein EYZ11_008163 [Aspergillus tanneri]|uniref:Uncharacterized protein n=1 Tax=Aspergillus tanneri TaxID=1220188 RepID=A0A4S3JB56_9EURO|nr:hypothetical protein EYZ11_008163 [Aspergillus tanneri]